MSHTTYSISPSKGILIKAFRNSASLDIANVSKGESVISKGSVDVNDKKDGQKVWLWYSEISAGGARRTINTSRTVLCKNRAEDLCVDERVFPPTVPLQQQEQSIGCVDSAPKSVTSKHHSHPGVCWNGFAAPLCGPVMTALARICSFPSRSPQASAVLTHLSQSEPLLGSKKKKTRAPSVRTLWEFWEAAAKPLIDRLLQIEWNKISRSSKFFFFLATASLLFKTRQLINSSTRWFTALLTCFTVIFNSNKYIMRRSQWRQLVISAYLCTLSSPQCLEKESVSKCWQTLREHSPGCNCLQGKNLLLKKKKTRSHHESH